MAGEIQLNSTTMATESSGSITAQLDVIRPNTTNGSLTLQGDSSNAGVTGLTIDSSGNATFAGTSNNLGTVTAGTISGGTIGSSVVFPAGKLINYDLQIINSTEIVTASSTTPDIAGTTGISITLPAGSSAIISAFGGSLRASVSTSRYDSTAIISYTTDGTTPTSTSNIIRGGHTLSVSPAGSFYVPGLVEGKVDNSTGSDLTLKWNWGVVGGSYPGMWDAYTDVRPISLKTLIFKN